DILPAACAHGQSPPCSRGHDRNDSRKRSIREYPDVADTSLPRGDLLRRIETAKSQTATRTTLQAWRNKCRTLSMTLTSCARWLISVAVGLLVVACCDVASASPL